MIPVKINDKKQNLPSFSELKPLQYWNFTKYLAEKPDVESENELIAYYIAFMSGIPVTKVFAVKTNYFGFISKQLGEFEVPFTIEKDEIIVKRRSKFIKTSKRIINTDKLLQTNRIGTKILTEKGLKKDNFENLLHALAANIDDTFDPENVEKIKKELENANYFDVLSNAAFFFRNTLKKKNNKMSILRSLWRFTKARIFRR